MKFLYFLFFSHFDFSCHLDSLFLPISSEYYIYMMLGDMQDI